MPPEVDIRRAAAKWVARYDTDAPRQVYQRVIELRAFGALEAYQLWLRIYEATRQLIANRRLH
jgi:hypothetical protein